MYIYIASSNKAIFIGSPNKVAVRLRNYAIDHNLPEKDMTISLIADYYIKPKKQLPSFVVMKKREGSELIDYLNKLENKSLRKVALMTYKAPEEL